MLEGGHEGSGAQFGATTRSWRPRHQHHPKPENQGSQHKQNQRMRSFAEVPCCTSLAPLVSRASRLHLEALFPLTAFKNAPNPKLVSNLSQQLFLRFPVRGDWNLAKICQTLSENSFFLEFWHIFDTCQSPWQEPWKTIAWDKFWTNLGFRAFLNAVRGKRGSQDYTHS